jgi:hypothetical protein
MSRFQMGGGGIIETDNPPRNGNGSGTPREGEQTRRQRPVSGGNSLAWAGKRTSPIIGGTGMDGATTSLMVGHGGGAAAGADTAALWQQLARPTYSTYRLMRTHPTIALVRSMIMAPVISSTWSAEPAREGVPEAWVKYVNETFIPHRRKFVTEALRALDFGHYKFELVWKYDGEAGAWVYEKLKPLAVDNNAVLLDRAGNFAGIRPAGEDDLGTQKSWAFTLDGEAGGILGRPRLENIRSTAWVDWLDCAWRNKKLREKISGIIPIFYHPPGGFDDPETGAFVSYQQACREAAEALMRGDYATIEHLGFNPDDLRNNPDLVKAGLIALDFYDAGNVATAQTGMLENLEYDDRQIFRGMLRPERQGLEARSGTRADAETHTDTGNEEGETLTNDLDESVSEGPVSEALAVNFGELARGKVRVKTAPLVNQKAARAERIVLALVKAGMGEAFARSLPIDAMLESMELPVRVAFVAKMGKKPEGNSSGDNPEGGGDNSDNADDGAEGAD